MLELLRAWFPNVLSVSVTTGVVLAVLLLGLPGPLAGRGEGAVVVPWRGCCWPCGWWSPSSSPSPRPPVEVTLPGQQEVVLQQPEASPPCPTGVTGGGNP